MTPELQNIINAYEGSKILRLGVAYMETPYNQRTELAKEAGLSLMDLARYAYRVRQYFPHTKPLRSYGHRLKPIWTNEEDNYLMSNYQTTPIREIKIRLKRRTLSAIYKRAALLGVNKRQD